MIQNITMPQLGESVTEGTIERWLVKVGDSINKYDPLAEVNTDKVQAEIPSSFSGIIKEILVDEGQTLPVGAVVCTIQLTNPVELPASPQPKKSNVSAAILNAGMHKPLPKTDDTIQKRELREPKARARYSPAVLKLAAEYSIDLESVPGTGVEGRITRKDVLAIIESKKQIVNQRVADVTEQLQEQLQPVQKETEVERQEMPPQVGDVEIPITSIRRAIANNMVRSKQEVPHAWMMMEVDVTELVAYRNAIKDEFKSKEGYNLTYFAFFIKVVAQALKEFPMMNATWAGDKIIQKKDIHMSIAVATENELFVPVIKHVDEKSIKGIAREIHELSQLARAKKLRTEHVSDGTFTINNTGSFGSIQSMGIINYPQAAILQMESIVKKPVIIDGNMFAIRDIVNICLSLDHRVLDGLICGNFLRRVKDLLEKTNKNTMSVY